MHSRFDLDDPATLEAGPGGGLLRDIGSHVVDQMLWLLGDVRSCQRPPGLARPARGPHRCGLHHRDGAHHRECARRWSRARSTISRCASCGRTAARAAIALWAPTCRHRRSSRGSGRRTTSTRWGYEESDRWGVLATQSGDEPVPSEQGRYHDLYAAFAAAIRGDGAQPVPAPDAVRTLSGAGRGTPQRRAAAQRRHRQSRDRVRFLSQLLTHRGCSSIRRCVPGS